MKKLFLMLAVAACMTGSVAQAEESNPMPTPTPEMVDIKIIVTPTPPPPVDNREIHYIEHDISSKAIDELASIFWADCNTDEEKMCVAAVAVNRLNHGMPFGTNIEDILSAESEWNHGHISDRNREKAVRYLNKALTQFVDGEYAGLKIPSTAVYISRDKSSHKLVFYNIDMKEIYRLS